MNVEELVESLKSLISFRFNDMEKIINHEHLYQFTNGLDTILVSQLQLDMDTAINIVILADYIVSNRNTGTACRSAKLVYEGIEYWVSFNTDCSYTITPNMPV